MKILKRDVYNVIKNELYIRRYDVREFDCIAIVDMTQGRIQTFATFAQANVRFYYWNILLQVVDSTKLQLLFCLCEKNITKST